MRRRPDWQVAAHECGHVAAALKYGIPFSWVAICEPSNPQHRGYVTTMEAGCDPRDVLRLIAAGPIAERRAAGWASGWDDGDDTPGSDWHDWTRGVAALAQRERCSPGHIAEGLFGEAQDLVRQEWPAIQRVADALVQRRLILAEDVRRLWRDRP